MNIHIKIKEIKVGKNDLTDGPWCYWATIAPADREIKGMRVIKVLAVEWSDETVAIIRLMAQHVLSKSCTVLVVVSGDCDDRFWIGQLTTALKSLAKE